MRQLRGQRGSWPTTRGMEMMDYRTALMETLFRKYTDMDRKQYFWYCRNDISRFADGNPDKALYGHLPPVGQEFYRELFERLEAFWES
jgi:hypothetical protein